MFGFSSPRKVTTDTLRKLAPFRQIPEKTLKLRLGSASLEQKKPGLWQPADLDNAEWFLIKGKISIKSANGSRVTLTHEDVKSAYPLPLSADRPVKIITPSTFLFIRTQDGIALQNTSANYFNDQIEVEEIGLSGEIYINFYTQLKSGKCELPGMPELALRVSKLIEEPDATNDDIGKLIQTDPALSARLLSVANSAAFAGVNRITTLQNAIARLGRKQIRNLVYSVILTNLFETDSKLLKQRLKKTWLHSCHVSAISYILAKHTPGLDPDQAMLAGLVHDIGVVPILNEARNHPELLEDAESLDMIIQEMRADIGMLTLSQWGLGSELIHVAKNAENWFRIGTALPGYLDIVQIAQLHAAITEGSSDKLPRIGEVPAYEKVVNGKLNPEASIQILKQSAQEIQELRRLLSGG